MDDWEDSIRGPGGIRYGVWIPRDPNYVKKKEQKAPEPPKAPAEDCISIKVVDDATGEVVPKVLLALKTPDGLTEPHETRTSGIIESLGLQSGTCELSSDLTDLTISNTLLFAGVGDKCSENGSSEKVPPPAPGTKYQIASVEEHKIKTGETLDGIARSAGMTRHALAKFNWNTDNEKEAEKLFIDASLDSGVIYIPKKWLQGGLATNQQHIIRVRPLKLFIEDDFLKRAGAYSRPLYYTYDAALNNGTGGFHYVFEEGSLSCSHIVGYDEQMCEASNKERVAIHNQSPSFVYADAGCWCDSAKGGGERRREFVLVCGPHVYLCEFDRSGTVPNSRVGSVQRFFTEMSAKSCGINVLKYINARNMADETNLFLFLGDLHLPPASWFDKQHDVIKVQGWDIFENAGIDLMLFLDALSNLSPATKQSLNFIQMGDMFELCLGRPYQFRHSLVAPNWEDNEAPYRVLNWTQEVITQNMPVIEAFQNLEKAGLAKVTYLWGNHDTYLQRIEITSQLYLPKREQLFRALNDTVLCEHGHRFDRSNFDNRSSGNFVMDAFAFVFPAGRKLEDPARRAASVGHPSERECYLLGATLINLYRRYDRKEAPFSVYIMAHTHSQDLLRFNVQIKEK